MVTKLFKLFVGILNMYGTGVLENEKNNSLF
jgi:hypothetical protein